MIEIDIPSKKKFQFEHLVLDLNGTIALDGKAIEGVEDKLCELSTLLSISIVTSDTLQNSYWLEKYPWADVRVIAKGNEDIQKLAVVNELGRGQTVTIGNGANDAAMLKGSALGICILGREGAALEAVLSSTVVVPDVNTALELLLLPDRLVATLRR